VASLCDSTLEQLRRTVAGNTPTPAGVAIAAVSASLALGLLAKVLAVSGRRAGSAAPGDRLASLAVTAEEASARLLRLAGEDGVAFEAYLTASRAPRSTDGEPRERAASVDAAVRRIVDLPLACAREAAAGLQLCDETSALIHPVVVADLAVCATLLASALRGFLACAQSNIRQLAPAAADYQELLARESERQRQAFRAADAVLGRVTAALQATGTP